MSDTEKTYTGSVRHIPPRPRSKRLRDAAGTAAGATTAAGAAYISSGAAYTPAPAGDASAHAHSNLPTLERLRADTEGYLYLTRRSDDGETAQLDKIRAGWADTAATLAEDSPAREWFVSRLRDDVVAGRITFQKAASMLGGLTIGDYAEGLRGGRVTSEGDAELESLRVRSFMEVAELVSLRSAVVEGSLSLSERAEVESITEDAQGRQIAFMRPQAGGCALAADDVVYGIASDGNARGKAWAKVAAKDGDALTLLPYADADVPGGRNLAITAGMTLTRHGNTRDPRRQQHFVISSDEGRLYMIQGARSPKTGEYGVVVGKLPAGLAAGAPVNADHPYVYARGLIARDLIRLDKWTGDAIREAVYRGPWRAGRAYHCDDTQYDTVTRGGVLYQCDIDGTTEPPSAASTAWTAIAGDAAADTAVWSIAATPAAVKAGKRQPVTLTALRATAAGVEAITDRADLAARGAEMRVIVTTASGTSARVVNIGPSGIIFAEDGDALTAETGEPLQAEGDDIAVPANAEAFTAELRDAASGSPLASLAIPVTRDGKDGEQGKDGMTGPVAYPAGAYDPAAAYDSTSGACPVVMDGGHYYRLAPGITVQGLDPAEDVAAQGGSWILVDNFDTVFARVVMAEFGLLNSAVFAGGWMTSQQGVRRMTLGGSVTEVCGSDYQLFDPSKPYRDPGQPFRPNVAVNFATGEIHTPQLSIAGGKLAAYGNGGARFEFGVDEAGMPVLAYYGADGERLYDFGPGGYTPPQPTADTYDEVRLLRLSPDDADLDALTPAQINAAKSGTARSVYYRRRSDGKLYPAKSLSAAPVEGIYAGEARYKPQQVGHTSDTDRTVAVYRYIGGQITQTRNIDFNSDTP